MKKKSVVQNAVMKHINEHSSLYVFITVLFLMGVIFGAILVNSLSFTQKEDLFYYLSQFFGMKQSAIRCALESSASLIAVLPTQKKGCSFNCLAVKFTTFLSVY